MIWKIILLVPVFILLSVVFVYTFSLFVWSIWTRGVPFVPLTKKQLEVINKHIKLKSTDRIIDLGCGDGRVLRIFEKQGVKDLTGYEINFWIYLLARIKNKISKSKSKIYFKDFKKVGLSEYNIVFCYLSDYCMNSLREKFDKELRPGTKIISYLFEVKDWHKPKIIYANKENKKSGKIFVYKISN